MKTNFLLFLSFHLGLSTNIDPFQPGPYNVDFTSIKPEIFGELDHHLDVFTPSSAGSFPVIVFFPGMACTVPSSAYSTILRHVASWGYVVLGPWALLYNPMDTYKAEWVDHVLHWAQLNFSNLDFRTSIGMNEDLVMDFTNIYFGAQSSGSHVAVQYIKQSQDCSLVKGMFLLSPVDGIDPFGMIQEYCIDPPNLLNFQTPTMIISGGLDSVPGLDNLGGIMPACAPEKLANDRFYNALTGPTMLINTTEYGHMDCLDEEMLDMVEFIHFCATDTDTDKEAYRTFVAGHITAFLKFVGEGDCSMGSLMEEVNREGILTMEKTKGGMESSCGQAGCRWQEEPYSYIRL